MSISVTFILLCFSHGLIAVQFGSDVFGSVFGVVKFPNTECYESESSGSEYGTCYTANECSDLGGTAFGTCANGYGVCCIFSLNCGEVSSQNNTYMIMTSTTTPEHNPCSYKICPMHQNICRIRFDFFNFDIAQPSAAGHCVTDAFVITGPEGGTPVICGTTIGNSLYIDSDGNECSEAVFSFGDDRTERSYKIRTRHYDCNDEYLAGPKGCLQYFTNYTERVDERGFIHYQSAFSFNIEHNHLANQDYNLCWRREPGVCLLCFNLYSNEYGLSAAGTADARETTDTACSRDYLEFTGNGVIPCGTGFSDVENCFQFPPLTTVQKNTFKNQLGYTRLCGTLADFPVTIVQLGIHMINNARQFCTSNSPFRARFVTDSDEQNLDASIGYRLEFWTIPC